MKAVFAIFVLVLAMLPIQAQASATNVDANDSGGPAAVRAAIDDAKGGDETAADGTYTGDGSGAFVATLLRAPGNNDFYFGGTVSPKVWLTSRDYSSLDFSAAIDAAPGAGGVWTFTIEYAPLPATQNPDDIRTWKVVSLGTISGENKSCNAGNIPVNIVAPACLRGHAAITGTSNTGKGGTVSLYLYDAKSDGPMHFQGTGGSTVSEGVFYAGNVFRTTNMDRAYWISSGEALRSCSGVVALPIAPGPGKTWHIQIAASRTALTGNQNAADLTYDLTEVATISGTQKSCSWTPVPFNVPAGGCVQLRGTCTGGASPVFSGAWYALDVSTSSTSPYNGGGPTYENAGSGAFDTNHQFGTGPWAISDRKPTNGNATLGQMYWIAPPSGLRQVAGAFTFESPIGGTGQFDIGLRISTAAPTSDQGCLDCNYIDTPALCSVRAGEKSCRFPLTSVDIPGNACFALMVKASGGTPSYNGQFNWPVCSVAKNERNEQN